MIKDISTSLSIFALLLFCSLSLAAPAERMAEYCIISRCQEIPLLQAHYGADAGIAGGAALCAESRRTIFTNRISIPSVPDVPN
jgi:hypothetical protein